MSSISKWEMEIPTHSATFSHVSGPNLKVLAWQVFKFDAQQHSDTSISQSLYLTYLDISMTTR